MKGSFAIPEEATMHEAPKFTPVERESIPAHTVEPQTAKFQYIDQQVPVATSQAATTPKTVQQPQTQSETPQSLLKSLEEANGFLGNIEGNLNKAKEQIGQMNPGRASRRIVSAQGDLASLSLRLKQSEGHLNKLARQTPRPPWVDSAITNLKLAEEDLEKARNNLESAQNLINEGKSAEAAGKIGVASGFLGDKFGLNGVSYCLVEIQNLANG